VKCINVHGLSLTRFSRRAAARAEDTFSRSQFLWERREWASVSQRWGPNYTTFRRTYILRRCSPSL